MNNMQNRRMGPRSRGGFVPRFDKQKQQQQNLNKSNSEVEKKVEELKKASPSPAKPASISSNNGGEGAGGPQKTQPLGKTQQQLLALDPTQNQNKPNLGNQQQEGGVQNQQQRRDGPGQNQPPNQMGNQGNRGGQNQNQQNQNQNRGGQNQNQNQQMQQQNRGMQNQNRGGPHQNRNQGNQNRGGPHQHNQNRNQGGNPFHRGGHNRQQHQDDDRKIIKEEKMDSTDGPAESQLPKKFTGRCRLFVGNLTNDTSEEEFREMFTPFGELSEVFVNAGRGFGFVKLDTRQNADAAKAALDGVQRKNRVLRVRFATHGAALKVKFIPPHVSNELLEESFSQFGQLERAVVIVDDRGKPTGEGIVEFARKPAAQQAIMKINEGAFLLGTSPRPILVEPLDQKDEDDGYPEKFIQKNPAFHKEREQGPRFAPPGSFEFEMAQKWKEVYRMEADHKLQLQREMEQAVQRLEMEAEQALHEHQARLLRQDLMRRQEELRKLEEHSQEMRQRMEMRRQEEDSRRQEEEMMRKERMMRQQQQQDMRRQMGGENRRGQAQGQGYNEEFEQGGEMAGNMGGGGGNMRSRTSSERGAPPLQPPPAPPAALGIERQRQQQQQQAMGSQESLGGPNPGGNNMRQSRFDNPQNAGGFGAGGSMGNRGNMGGNQGGMGGNMGNRGGPMGGNRRREGGPTEEFFESKRPRFVN